MKTRRKYLLLPLLLCIAAACSNQHERLTLVQVNQPSELENGISFDMDIEQGYTYSTAIVCSIDAAQLFKEKVNLSLEVIAPNYDSFKEKVTFPLVQNGSQRAALGGERAAVRFQRHGSLLDNQWGWRRGITCDTLPGRWRVIITADNPTDMNRIRAVGFSYKGEADE